MAEEELTRTGRAYSFSFPGANPDPNPLSEQVAFVSSVYARKNPVAYQGDRVATRPTGFHIVGYKTGEVRMVPVEDVRIFSLSGRRSFIPVYPGMKEYASSRMRLPEIEFADGRVGSSKAREFFTGVRGKDDCASCRK